MRLRLALLAIAIPEIAHANDDITVGTFAPTPSIVQRGFNFESPAVGANGAWTVSTTMSIATNLLVLDGSAPAVEMMPQITVATETPIARRWEMVIGGAYAFLDRFEVGASMPLDRQTGDRSGDLRFMAADGNAIGDLAFHAKMRLLDRGSWRAGVSIRFLVPTSTDRQFTGADHPTGRATALAEWSPSKKLTVGVMAGATIRHRATYRDTAAITQSSAFAFDVAGVYRATDRVSIIAEVFGEVGELSPIEALAGALYRIDNITVGAALGRGLTDEVGSPGIRAVVSVGYAR